MTEAAGRRWRRAAWSLALILAVAAIWSLWPRPSGRPPRATLGASTAGASAVAFDPEGRSLALGEPAGSLAIWDIAGPEPARRLGIDAGLAGEVGFLGFSGDGATLVAGMTPTPLAGGQNSWACGWRLWDAADGTERPASAQDAFLRDARFEADGSVVLSLSEPPAGRRTKWRERLSIRDVATWQEQSAVVLGSKPGCATAIAPDGRSLAAVTPAGEVTLFGADGRALRSFQSRHAYPCELRFSPDGRTLAVAHGDRRATVELWDAATGRLRLTIAGPTTHVASQLAFSPDGRVLATTAGPGRDAHSLPRRLRNNLPGPLRDQLADPPPRTQILLWDAADGSRLDLLEAPTVWISALSYSPDGRTLAAAGPDCGVMLWDVPVRHPSAAAHETQPGGSGDRP